MFVTASCCGACNPWLGTLCDVSRNCKFRSVMHHMSDFLCRSHLSMQARWLISCLVLYDWTLSISFKLFEDSERSAERIIAETSATLWNASIWRYLIYVRSTNRCPHICCIFLLLCGVEILPLPPLVVHIVNSRLEINTLGIITSRSWHNWPPCCEFAWCKWFRGTWRVWQ